MKFVFLLSFFLSEIVFASPIRMLIRQVNVLDVKNKKVILNQDLLLENGRIKRIANSGVIKVQARDQVIDGRKNFATPGLIDSHVHTDLYHWEKSADDWSLPLYLANGVTTIRDCAGSSLTLKMRTDIEGGKLIGPRMVVASPFITSVSVNPGSNEFQVTTAEETVAKVSSFLAEGYDAVKVDSDLNLESYEAAAGFLKSRKSYLYGHALWGKPKGYWQILLPEVLKHYRTLEHIDLVFGDFMQSNNSPFYQKTDIDPSDLDWQAIGYADFSKANALISLLKENQSIVSPTLVVLDDQLKLDIDAADFYAAGIDGFRKDALSQYVPDSYFSVWTSMYKTWGYGLQNPKRKVLLDGFANMKKLVKILNDAGIPIIAGTDTPARPKLVAGFALHEELAEYQDAGLSNWDTLRTATVHPAMALQKENEIGVIQVGAFADLILTTKNPVDSISALKNPDWVVARGIAYDRAHLDQMLEQVRKKVRTLPNPVQSVNLNFGK